jgi:uncharacterized protein
MIRVFLLLLLALPLQAQYTVESVPDPKRSGVGYVSDPDNYLSAEEREAINVLLGALEDSTTAQVAVVLLQSIGEENPKDFATRLFAEWGIGQASKDNGLLILSVMDQRRTEFETGYGMEAVLPDIYCYRIGMQELVPSFREEKYGEGILKALTRISEILQDPDMSADIRAEISGEKEQPFEFNIRYLWFFVAFNAFVVFLIMLRLRWIFQNKDDLYDKYLAVRPWMSLFFLILSPLLYLPLFFYLKNVLKKLRAHPRYSKVNGKPMHRLAEGEEDAYLKRGQITEEHVGSVDYDVWVTDEGDDVQILAYLSRFSGYSTCKQCRYKTFHHEKTVVLKAATYSSSGLEEKRYHCKNCDYRESRQVVIPQKVRSSGGSGGSSRGGGSWGGGRSGGGGAGVGW